MIKLVLPLVQTNGVIDLFAYFLSITNGFILLPAVFNLLSEFKVPYGLSKSSNFYSRNIISSSLSLLKYMFYKRNSTREFSLVLSKVSGLYSYTPLILIILALGSFVSLLLRILIRSNVYKLRSAL